MISYLQKKTTMMNKGALAMYITNDIRYIGVNDHEVDLFEGQYPVPNGIAYNSWIRISPTSGWITCPPSWRAGPPTI